jgi:hypothetical protein
MKFCYAFFLTSPIPRGNASLEVSVLNEPGQTQGNVFCGRDPNEKPDLTVLGPVTRVLLHLGLDTSPSHPLHHPPARRITHVFVRFSPRA